MIDYKKYLEIPYKPLGRDWNGCDCWGLLCLIAKGEYGITLPDGKLHKILPEEEIANLESLSTAYRQTNSIREGGIGLCFINNLHAVMFLTPKLCIEMLPNGVFVAKASKYENEYIRFYELKDK